MIDSSQAPNPTFDLAETAQRLEQLRREVAKIIVGQTSVVEQILTALIARGHCLLIGVPGLAKTIMARTLADALAMQFARVQFTPDLMPSDITGTTILDQHPETGQRSFRFNAGPLFANVVLADEINRTPPKTQAALLEAMQEHRVTTGTETRDLPDPFFVIATQNPLEQEGTYPLPEAQLDRFMFAVSVTYPTHAEENRIVASTTRPQQIQLEKILSVEDVLTMQNLVRRLPTPPEIVRYCVDLARATRPTDSTAPDFIKQHVDSGAGPRAGQYLVLAAKSRAVLSGRLSPDLDDVRAAAPGVLRHRLFTNFTALSQNITSDDLVQQLLDTLRHEPSDQPIVYPQPTSESAIRDDISLESVQEQDKVELIRRAKAIVEAIHSEVRKTIIGQRDVVDFVLAALLAGGHCLLVGVPGLAKTTLVKTIADVLELEFKRVQFTPDLMPSDITGTDIIEIDQTTGQRDFRFMPGPIFTNLLLADEINRTPPKTQAALLEAMQERAVTAGSKTYPLAPPFLVLATQNPLEQEGTYPLPEAQLDRFMFEIRLDYPAASEEPIIVDRTTSESNIQPMKVVGGPQILLLQQVIRRVPVSRHVLTYATTLVRATRPQTRGRPDAIKQYVHCGASPRAGQFLILGAKARAVMDGRLNVSIADVRTVALPVLCHRIFTNFAADAEGVTPIDLVRMLIKKVPEPKIKDEQAMMGE